MRTAVLAVVAAFACSAAATAHQSVKTGTPEAREATRHYQQGWDAMHAERYPEAVLEFQKTIEFNPDFAEAYYSLGRAHMGARDFIKAIAAYQKCREVYTTLGGKQYSNELDYKRHLEDRILEVQTALNQARQPASGAAAASKALYVRELQNKLTELQNAHERSINVSVDTSIPFFVPMSLGAAYFRNNQFPEAEREYKTALEANSSSGETHNNLAVLYLMTDRVELAQNEIKLAEQTGYKVNPNLKEDVGRRIKKGGD